MFPTKFFFELGERRRLDRFFRAKGMKICLIPTKGECRLHESRSRDIYIYTKMAGINCGEFSTFPGEERKRVP